MNSDLTLVRVLVLFREFAKAHRVVRGQVIEDDDFTLCIFPDGNGHIEAILGLATPETLAKIIATQSGHVDCYFENLGQLQSILSGDVSPEWVFDDERE